ncbi:MAG: keywimysin-related RiPP [Pseudonocardiaceae bacterium]
MRTYERPTLRASGSFIKKTGLGVHGPADLIFLSHKN